MRQWRMVATGKPGERCVAHQMNFDTCPCVAPNLADYDYEVFSGKLYAAAKVGLPDHSRMGLVISPRDGCCG